jgi:uncharacterized Zn finger protein
MGKEKKLCKQVKHEVLEEDLEAYKKLVTNPTHLCLKCGRVCNDKHLLCEPEKLPA